MTLCAAETSFSLSVNVPAVYTAAHFFCKVPLIKNIAVHGVPCSLCGDLTVSVSGKTPSGSFLDFAVTKKDFVCSDYIPDGSDTLILDLEKYAIFPDASFIHGLSVNAPAKIRISVSVGEISVSGSYDIKISPFGHVCPEMPPELLCTYVMPGCEFAKKSEKNINSMIKQLSEKHGGNAPEELLYAEAAAMAIRSAKLTYSAVYREMLDGDCIIRDPDNLTSSNKRSVSQTEAALLYCSCAERCGLDVGITYLRKGAGSVKTLVSISLGGYKAKTPVSESISALREKLLSGELFVFDILGLLGTENTDFSRNVTESAELVLRSSSTLAFSVDVTSARMCGVISLRPCEKNRLSKTGADKSGIEAAITDIDKNADSVLLYGFSPYNSISLGFCKSADIPDFGSTLTLCPLDNELICHSTDSFLAFSDFAPRNLSEYPRTISEQAVFESKLSGLLSEVNSPSRKNTVYVYPSRYILSGEKLTPEKIRDCVLSDAAALCDSEKASPYHGGNTMIYAVIGTVSSGNGYAPCACVPCSLSVSNGGVRLTFGTGKTVFNRSLEKLSEKLTGTSFGALEAEILAMDSNGISGIKDSRVRSVKTCLESWKALCGAFPDKLSFSDSIFICAFDLSFAILRECLENSKGAEFEKYIESGKYTFPEKGEKATGRLRTFLPFDIPTDAENAVREAKNGSMILSGIHGSGKKKILGSIIASYASDGKNILAVSKYRESLDSLYETVKAAGISELCLNVTDSDSTKKQILSDIERMQKKPDSPKKDTFDDAAILEHGFSLYADNIYRKSALGLSPFDCADMYCRYDLVCPGKPINLGTLPGANVDTVFELAKELSEKAHSIYGMSRSEKNDISAYLKYIKTEKQLPENISEKLCEASCQLRVFAEKSAPLRTALGLSDASLTNIHSLYSLGEFTELIMNSGTDYIPALSACDVTPENANGIERICDVIDELSVLHTETPELTENTDASFTELYEKWNNSETNPFARSGITAQVKKLLGKKTRFGAKDTEVFLRAASRREELENELSSVPENVSACLGNLWNGRNTDTEKARKLAAFLNGASLSVKKLTDSQENAEKAASGLPSLIKKLTEDTSANAEFILSVGTFRKLCSEKTGLLPELSDALGFDMSEPEFPDGLLSENGLCRVLNELSGAVKTLTSVHTFNTVKAHACSAGLSGAVRYIDENGTDPLLYERILKSIYYAFARNITSDRTHPEGEALYEKYRRYKKARDTEKELITYRIISAKRKKFTGYISQSSGKKELKNLTNDLHDSSLSISEILDRYKNLLSVMYTAVLCTALPACGLESYPQTLILLDANRTSAAEGLPLCIGFDRCIFVSTGFVYPGSLMSCLPEGIPEYSFTSVQGEKNGNVASFIKSMFPDFVAKYISEKDCSGIEFIKCDGGLYDKNTGANKIEALKVCETALVCAEKYGFENVGIIAFTPAQTTEIACGLEILKNKYRRPEIANIPVHCTENTGDFTKDCIILSCTFGKNIYSITRSFASLDNKKCAKSGIPAELSVLLCSRKKLIAVSSAEPQDIMTDSLMPGAAAISALLSFVKYASIPCDVSKIAERAKRSGIEMYLCRKLSEENPGCTVRCGDGTVRAGKKAVIYENGYIRDVYDRMISPYSDAESKGFDADFSDILSIIRKDCHEKP